jgi:dUTP pyrophosphatase
LKIRLQRLPHASDLPLPSRGSSGSSGFDLRAAVEGETVLLPGGRQLVPTGLVLEIPLGYEGQVRPRSGLALKHGIGVLNSPGTIDSDYRGEVGVILVNHGVEPFPIRRGDRIAQLVIARVEEVEWEEPEAGPLGESGRGAGGFGSTGTA